MKHILLQSLLLTGCLSLALPARAWEHQHVRDGSIDRSGTFHTAHGRTGTFNSSVSHEPGMTSGTTTRSYANGGGYTHTFNNNWNTASGTGTHQSSTTFANGASESSQGTATRTAPGDYSYTGTHTGVNGNVTDISKTSSFNSATDTRTVDNTYTNPTTGKSATVDKSIANDPSAGTRTVDTTATGPAGKTASSDQTYTKTSDGYSKDGTLTGPAGNSATDQSNVSFTKDANGQITRTQTTEVTGPEGKEHMSGNTETYTRTATPTTPTP